MVTGVSGYEIEALMGGHGHPKTGTTRPMDLMRALDAFRLELGKRNRCKGVIPAKTALLTIRLRLSPGRFHWALWHGGKYYDSCADRALTPAEFGLLLAAEKAHVTSWCEIKRNRFGGRVFSRANTWPTGPTFKRLGEEDVKMLIRRFGAKARYLDSGRAIIAHRLWDLMAPHLTKGAQQALASAWVEAQKGKPEELDALTRRLGGVGTVLRRK
jgi:hypothetical protein